MKLSIVPLVAITLAARSICAMINALMHACHKHNCVLNGTAAIIKKKIGEMKRECE